MDFLGVGLPELLVIFTLVLLVFGPDEMLSAGKSIGLFFNKLTNSEHWATVKEVNRQVKNLPSRLAREANIADLENDLHATINEKLKIPEVPIFTTEIEKDTILGPSD